MGKTSSRRIYGMIEKLNLKPLDSVNVPEAVELRKQRDELLELVLLIQTNDLLSMESQIEIRYMFEKIIDMPWNDIKAILNENVRS